MARFVDFLELVRRLPREVFIEQCPYYLLVGKLVLDAPRTPRRTEILDVGAISDFMEAPEEGTNATRNVSFDHGPQTGQTMVLPVRKVQSTFPSMITVGRTANNDIVIGDINISRFHAYFRVFPDRIEIADAGSANGTFVEGKRLPAKGTAQLVIPGETVAFAQLEFTLLDAGRAWDRIRKA